jgi:hypothetical protein
MLQVGNSPRCPPETGTEHRVAVKAASHNLNNDCLSVSGISPVEYLNEFAAANKVCDFKWPDMQAEHFMRHWQPRYAPNVRFVSRPKYSWSSSVALVKDTETGLRKSGEGALFLYCSGELYGGGV